MKKQINSTIKAHLIRGAFYLLLLLAVCAIPFALARRNAGKQPAQRAPFSLSQLPKFPYSSLREHGSAPALPAGEGTATPTPTASPTPTATPVPGCGLLVGDGLAVGLAANNYTLIASNIVNFTFSNSQTAPNDFAIFQTHDPFGSTVVKDAITGAGHTFSVFTPGDLSGFDFTQYRVIVLNWDDHFLSDFLAPYSAAIPALEAYISGGGVVWIQGAIQHSEDWDSYPLPFGGESSFDLSMSDPIVDPSNPMVAGVPNPITGNPASQASDEDLPGDADIVVVKNEEGARVTGGGEDQRPVLYDLFRGTTCVPTPTPTPSPSPTPTASPTPTSTPVPGCGLLVGDGLAVGFAPNNYTLIASNIVNFTFSNSQTAPNDFAIFQTHDPFGSTVVKDAITAAGHSFTVFTPAQLAGFDFTQYRVIVLNWDDHFLSDFLAPYVAAIPALEAYISGGGVVWVQGAIQPNWDENSYPLPFGGESSFDLSMSDPIVDPSNPMVAGVPNPITGDFASQASDEDLPGDADVVVVKNEEGTRVKGGGEDQRPVLYDLFRGTACVPTPTPSPSPTPTATASPTPTSTATPTPTGTPVGCVSGRGFWRNHPDQWPVTQLQLGNVTYNQQQLLSILQQPVNGNGLVLLARQEIVAKLNIANGADGSCIQQTLSDADSMIGDLVVPPVGNGFLSPRDVEALVETLGAYNEGDLCAPECEEDSSPPPSPTEHPRPPTRHPMPRH